VKRPNFPLKSAAVASSVLLAGGFVSYHAGAFNSLLRTAPPVKPIAQEPQADADRQESPVMSSSKSIIFAADEQHPTPWLRLGDHDYHVRLGDAAHQTPGEPTAPPSAAPQKKPEPPMLGGSKAIFIPQIQPLTPDTPPASPAAPPPPSP
jgi:hypothetical protein